jgi:WhiB family transcriptional regulator, redox-sensing transcriptional regulator
VNDDWTSYAACRQPGVDPEWFFPVGDAGPALDDVAAAKAVCARCLVARECLDWALRVGEPAGVWGGTTPEERRTLRVRRREWAELKKSRARSA